MSNNTTTIATQKAFAAVFGLIIAAMGLEGIALMLAPDRGTPEMLLGEYPDNPRGYFDALPSIGGTERFGINMRTGIGIGGRTGDLATNRPTARILGLGDSHAQGQGVRFEDTLYEQLGDLLQAGGTQTSVRNAAVSGYHLEDIAARYLYETENNVRYPLVIYTLVLDDFSLEPTDDPDEEFVRTIPEHDDDPWRDRSAIWNLIVEYKERAEVSEATADDYLADFTANFKSAKFAAKSDLMAAMARQVEADGGTLVVAIMPLFYQLEDYPFAEVHKTLAEMGREKNIRIVDLYPALSARKASDLWVHETDHHPNEIGHALAAEAVATYLKNEGLLKGL